MMALPSDEFLLSAFARGDRDAFDRLTARYSGVLDSYFRRRLPDAGAFEVRAAIEKLPEPLREALLLTRFEGLPATEAGEILGCSPAAVRARVFRARSLLARRLNPATRRKT